MKNFVGKVYPRKGYESLLRIKKSDSNKIFRESVQNRSEITVEVTYWCASIFIVDPGLETMTCRNSE